jgi:hypothetical protein
MQHLDGRQITLPLFDKALLSAGEEMVEVTEQPQSRQKKERRFEIVGGVNKGAGPQRRLFAAGRIKRF